MRITQVEVIDREIHFNLDLVKFYGRILLPLYIYVMFKVHYSKVILFNRYWSREIFKTF